MKKLAIVLAISMLLTGSSQAATIYDLSREFSAINNPNEAWSYGSSDTLGGPLVLISANYTAAGDNGVPLAGWSALSGIPAIFKIVGTSTATSDGGAGQYPPESIKAQAGDAANPGRYMISRFTVPSDGAGTYHIETTARAYLSGAASRDTDFHVLHNGTELFGIFLPANGATAYTNDVLLAAGDVIDFATGPGADESSFASGLFVTARLVTQCEPITVTNTVSLATLRAGINSASLAHPRPVLAHLNQAATALDHLSRKIDRRVAPGNPELAAQLQAWIDQLIGLPPE